MRQELSQAFQGAKKAPKHHYIPVFYLKQWVGCDGRLCEFSRPHDVVKPRRTAPYGTGYVRGLYTLPGVPAEKANILENTYMRSADDWAARALQVLLNAEADLDLLTPALRAGWSRFLYCMLLRSPEYLERLERMVARDLEKILNDIQPSYADKRSLEPSLPVSFEEFKAKMLADPFTMSPKRFLHSIIDSQRVIDAISRMRWWTISLNNPRDLLLTSDRPVIMTNGIGIKDAHIAMPISHQKIFFATGNMSVFRKVKSLSQEELVSNANSKVTEQARNFVYGFSDVMLPFVERNLGKRIPASPLETKLK